MSLQSLRAKLLILIASIFTCLMLVVAINNAIAYNELQKSLYEVTKINLSTFQNRLDDLFSLTENYLIDFSLNNSDIFIIEQDQKSESKWFSANYRLKKEFNSASTVYDLDGFFLYSVNSDTFIVSNSANMQTTTSSAINKHIKNYIDAHVNDNSVNINEWLYLSPADTPILLRILKINNSYYGAWVTNANILQPFVGDELKDFIFLIDENGNFLTKDPTYSTLSIGTDIISKPDVTLDIQDETYMVVTAPLRTSAFSLLALIPEKQFNVDIQKYWPVIVIAIFMVIVFMVITLFMINQLVIHPLDSLHEAIITLKDGNLNTRVELNKSSSEFTEINTTFNAMVQEIESLRINIYEEKLEKQNINLNYLKLQIAPHFLINSLSLAYQLAELEKPELSKQLLHDLSRHLRYTLTSEAMVTLEEELNHVRNYINLSSIRFPGSIQFYEDIDPESHNASVIVLLIQSFVENSIKYEVFSGKTTSIHITTESIIVNGHRRLHICIWDSGRGFDVELLKRLQNITTYIEDKVSKHYGISNVYQRAVLIFGQENCKFSFSNRPRAGAQIDIDIPHVIQHTILNKEVNLIESSDC